jgi:hypothetical protein
MPLLLLLHNCLWLQVTTIIMLNAITASGGVAAAVTTYYHCWPVMQPCMMQPTVAEVLLHELKLELLLQVVTAAVFGCCCILLLPHGSLVVE